jgi:hypothetical protein
LEWLAYRFPIVVFKIKVRGARFHNSLSAGAKDAFKVPDCFCGLWIHVVQEATSIALVEDPCESPQLFLQRLNVEDLDQQHVAGLGTLNVKGPGEVVHPRQVDVEHVVSAVIVADLAAGPVDAFDFDRLVDGDGGHRRDWGKGWIRNDSEMLEEH